MDRFIISISFIILCFTISISTLTIAIFCRNRQLKIFAYAFACLGAGYLGILLQMVIVLPFMIIPANLLVMTGYMLFYGGIRLFNGDSMWPRIFWIYLAVSMIITVIFTSIYPSMAVRTTILQLLLFLILYQLYFYLKKCREMPLLVKNSFRMAIVITVLVYAVRMTLLNVASSSGDDHLLQDTLINYSYIIYMIILILWFAAAIMLQNAKMLDELSDEKEKYRLLADHFNTTLISMAEGVLATDTAGTIKLMNPMAEKLTGWSAQDAIGQEFHSVFRYFNLITKEKGRDILKYVLETGKRYSAAKSKGIISKDGSELFIEANASGIYDESGEPAGVVVSFRDISKEYELEMEIETLLEINLDMLYVTDMKGVLLKFNNKFEEVLGYKTEELEGGNILSFVHEEDARTTVEVKRAAEAAALAGDSPVYGMTSRVRCKDGSYKYIEWRSIPISDKYIYSSARDITEQKLLEEKLKESAVKDELTGLFNRRYFETRIFEEMERSDRYSAPLSMAILDIDHFKLINDRFGHPAGDDQLRLIARIMENTTRSVDVLCRIGGEEFMIIMPETDLRGAAEAAEKVRGAIEQYVHPVTGRQTASFGVAERMNFESFRHWYKRLDNALYDAKQNGRNRVVSSDGEAGIQKEFMMISWENEWESGNPEIDAQHKRLAEFANRFISMSGKLDQVSAQKEFGHLLEHVTHHFEREEMILKEIGYPEHGRHAELHQNLAAKALWIRDAYDSGIIQFPALLSFVVDTVILGHMLEEDTKFFPYIQKQQKKE